VFLDEGMKQQVEFDAESLTKATGVSLSAGEWEQFMAVQRQVLRWTFLGSGMAHPNFLVALEHIQPGAGRRMSMVATDFS
jgi:hypothetical protein